MWNYFKERYEENYIIVFSFTDGNEPIYCAYYI